MTDPFAAALVALFAGPGSAAAAYQAQESAPVPVRVIRSRPDLATGFGESRVIQGSNSFEIMKSAVPQPAAGDLLAIGGEIVAGEIEGGELFELIGEPMLDVEGLSWLIGAEPYS